jgi:hypothetical protein
MAFQFQPKLVAFALVTLGWTSLCPAQTQLTKTPAPPTDSAKSPQLGPASTNGPLPSQPTAGSIHGTIVDQSGAAIAGARVTLTRSDDQSLNQAALSGGDGQFFFPSVAPGAFQLAVTSPDFAPQASSGVLRSSEILTLPQIALAVATNITDVEVGVSQIEVAEDQIKVEEKQRVLGVLPNFYVSYVADAAPLTSRQKFKLAWKTAVDPFTLVFVAGAAGVEQGQNHFNGYGQGVQGYAKRFGAGYADTVAGTFIGAAILPSLLKQDPRYFYKGTGSTPSRALYATANAVICKGDNGRWQANYSNILGSFAAGGISNLYYPAQDRNGAGLTLENGALGIGITAVANLFQEFVIRKLTPKTPNQPPQKP